MRMFSRLLVSPAMTIAVTAIVIAVAIIVLVPNTITITNAQQQQPPVASQPPAVTQNSTTLFQSTEDGIRLRVPDGWIIHDVNNTGSLLSEESAQGYGIIAQLCPEEEQEQAAVSNVSTSGNTATISCQGSEGEVIHIIRYPDLDTRLFANNATTTNNNMTTTTADNILTYHLQKLQEVGYRSMQIVNSTDVTSNVTNAQTNQTIATVPAKFVEMTYNTASAPNETRQGYFVLTATNATHPNLGMTKGYSVFYEGSNSSATSAETTRPSGILAPRPLAAPVRDVFDSFELIAVVVPTEEPLTVEIISSSTLIEGEAPATFEFEANVVGGTEPYTYSWDFDGDGTEDSNQLSVSRTFDEDGTYNVTLTVTDSSGRTASDNIEVTVEEAPPAEEVVEEDVEEEPIPLPPPVEEEEEEQEQPPSPPPPADDVAENIEDEVDDFVQELLDRFGVENPGSPE